MLARVAESIYWMARYVERAEDLSRLVNVNAHLALDLPRGVAPAWDTLINIIGAEPIYEQRFAGETSEARIVRFLIADQESGHSIVSSLKFARENARSVREAIPREVFEAINILYHYSRDHVNSGISKRGRHAYLNQVILRCQTVAGVLADVMNRDEAYQFFLLGQALERADMVTRILDVRSASLIADNANTPEMYETVQWISVLKSLSGHQMYRLARQRRIHRAEVLRFVLQHQHFPRSVMFCAQELKRCMKEIGDANTPLRAVSRIARHLRSNKAHLLEGDDLNHYLDQIQVDVIGIHNAVSDTYFSHSLE